MLSIWLLQDQAALDCRGRGTYMSKDILDDSHTQNKCLSFLKMQRKHIMKWKFTVVFNWSWDFQGHSLVMVVGAEISGRAQDLCLFEWVSPQVNTRAAFSWQGYSSALPEVDSEAALSLLKVLWHEPTLPLFLQEAPNFLVSLLFQQMFLPP